MDLYGFVWFVWICMDFTLCIIILCHIFGSYGKFQWECSNLGPPMGLMAGPISRPWTGMGIPMDKVPWEMPRSNEYQYHI